jgi:hypothetical protein
MDGTIDIDTLTPGNFIATRRTFVRGWAEVLKAIEQSYDPTFDPHNPDDIPVNCVTPPLEASGRQLPCTDPKYIVDPKARAAYVDAIAKNDEKNARAMHYTKVLLLDQQAMSSLSLTLDLLRKIAPDGASADFVQLDSILQQVGLSDARRTEIDAMFYARPGI